MDIQSLVCSVTQIIYIDVPDSRLSRILQSVVNQTTFFMTGIFSQTNIYLPCHAKNVFCWAFLDLSEYSAINEVKNNSIKLVFLFKMFHLHFRSTYVVMRKKYFKHRSPFLSCIMQLYATNNKLRKKRERELIIKFCLC